MIREPEGVDLVIAPHKFTEQDRQMTLEAIAESKTRFQKKAISRRTKRSSLHKIAVL